MSITDMTRGVYRRLYSGATRGRRINSVTEGAEVLFWRLVMVADDLGNFHAEPLLVKAEAMPLRKTTVAHIKRRMAELDKAGLITTYESDGEKFGHIVGWEDLQPLGYDEGRNRRKAIQRCPSPPDYEALRSDTKATKANDVIRPETETESETESESETDSHTDTETESDFDTKADAGSGSTRKFLGSVSGSDSGKPLSRPVAHLRYTEAVAPLIGRNGDGTKHPRGSKQFEADTTVTAQWWDDVIWPRDDPPDAARRRFEQAMKLIADAKQGNKAKPMAWLTTRIKQLGSKR